MSLLYLDSFDHYTAAQKTMKWTSGTGSIVTGLHGDGMKPSGSGITKGIVFGNTTTIFGFAVQFTGLGVSILGVFDSSVVQQWEIEVQQDGSIRGHNGPAGDTIFLTDPDTLRTGIWYYFEYESTCHASAGTAKLRLDGIELVNLTGIDTTHSVGFSGSVRSFRFEGGGSMILDDLIVMDSVDDTLNDPRWEGGGGFDKFLGQIEIVCKYPNADTTSDWTPSAGSDNYAMADEVEPDEDTTYNACLAADVGDADLFGIEDLALGEDILGAQLLVCARKTEEGVATLTPQVKQGATTYDGDEVGLSESYSYVTRTVYPSAPDGTLWTKAKFDAIEAGYTRES